MYSRYNIFAHLMIEKYFLQCVPCLFIFQTGFSQIRSFQFINLSVFPTYRSCFWCQVCKLFAKFYISKIFYFVHFLVLQFYLLHSICDLFLLREIQLL